MDGGEEDAEMCVDASTMKGSISVIIHVYNYI